MYEYFLQSSLCLRVIVPRWFKRRGGGWILFEKRLMHLHLAFRCYPVTREGQREIRAGYFLLMGCWRRRITAFIIIFGIYRFSNFGDY